MEKINSKKTVDELVLFIKEVFEKAGFFQAVIALSGGIDSSLSCALTTKALGKKNVFPILLPYGKLNDRGLKDAYEVIHFLQIPARNVSLVNIEPAVNTIVKTNKNMGMLRKGNIMARVRMIYVYDQAKKRNALVVGTENKTEHFLGYFTRFGDEASDLEPLCNLYKTHVYELSRFFKLPESVLFKKPTAGLWENQTDEDELGFFYKDADMILYCHYDKGLKVGEIHKKTGIKQEIIKKVLEYANKNSFKQYLPYIPKRKL